MRQTDKSRFPIFTYEKITIQRKEGTHVSHTVQLVSAPAMVIPNPGPFATQLALLADKPSASVAAGSLGKPEKAVLPSD